MMNFSYKVIGNRSISTNLKSCEISGAEAEAKTKKALKKNRGKAL